MMKERNGVLCGVAVFCHVVFLTNCAQANRGSSGKTLRDRVQ
jgi:hypothetical protein